MYERFYGLQTRPFGLTPDLRFLFLTAKHSEALAHLEYGLSGRKGITVLVGEVGTGKTTVLRAALDPEGGSPNRSPSVSQPRTSPAESGLLAGRPPACSRARRCRSSTSARAGFRG